MKKSIFTTALFTLVTIGLISQEQEILLTIADEPVTLEEFERIYRKNNNETSLNRQTPEEYLELFINFRLKVKEAESRGMDTTTKFINELEGYRVQLAKPYLADEAYREQLLREAYERSKLDIKASHILITLPQGASPEDTLAAFEKISEIRERIVKGEPFETVARATSDDSSVKRNGGSLNYFTVFSMIYDFETVAYNTPVNSISEPFRSNYGYHILKVHDRRPARGQIKVAHIFVRTPETMGEDQKKEAYEKVQMIYDSLQIGADFAHMARTYSEDATSARMGGETSWFGTGRMVPVFEDACFALEENGDISEPVRSSYGWHIIKRLDRKGIGTFEEMKPELQEKANRGDRAKHRTDLYVNKLKQEYGFSEYPEGLSEIYASVDSSLIYGTWNGEPFRNLGTPLLKIGEKIATTGEFVVFMEEKQTRRAIRDARTYADQLYGEFVKEVVMKYEESRLPLKFPEYRYIYEEYHDGILLFDIMDQMVWSKAVTDTLGLEAFHNAHKEDYMWKERSDALIVTCTEGVDVAAVRKAYKKILKGKLDQESLNRAYCNNDTIQCITLKSLLVEEGENEMVDALEGRHGLGPVMEDNGRTTFVLLKGIRPPEPKKLSEARGQITSDYQNYLEEQWIGELKQKYPVQVNTSLISRIVP